MENYIYDGCKVAIKETGITMKKLYLTFLILTIAGLLSGCIDQNEQTPPTGEKGYTDITAPELKEMMSQGAVFLLDTHIPEQEHIKGTDEFIPFNEIDANLDKLPADKDARIVVYCRSGSMSATASGKLVEQGYTDVNNLLGGANEWRKQGYEFDE